MARRKVMNGEKSPWGQRLTRPVPNGRRRSGIWLVPENLCMHVASKSDRVNLAAFRRSYPAGDPINPRARLVGFLARFPSLDVVFHCERKCKRYDWHTKRMVWIIHRWRKLNVNLQLNSQYAEFQNWNLRNKQLTIIGQHRISFFAATT